MGRDLQGSIGSYSVMWCAKGDGTTDDTVAINRAIEFAQGRPIFFPPNKTFKISGALTTIRSYTVFYGEGSNIIQDDEDAKTFVLLHSNCVVRGFKITYNGTATAAGSFAKASAIHGVSVNNCIIERNEIVSPSSCGITLLGSSSNNKIIHNKVSGMVDTSQDVAAIALGYDTQACNNNLIAFNTVDGTPTTRKGNNGIMILSAGEQNKIIGNNITNFRRYGIIVYQPGGTEDFSLQNNSIHANIIENIGYPTATDNFGGGIYLQSSHYTDVIGNTVFNSGINSNDISLPVAAIENNSSSYCTISGNIIKTGLNGIRMTSSRSSIVSSNVITDMSKKGIFDYAGHSNIIDDNIITEIAQEGVTSTAALFQLGTPWVGEASGINIQITNNTIQSIGIAIQVDKASGYGTYPTGARITGNTATSASNYTLYCQTNKSIYAENILGNTHATPDRVLGITEGAKNIVSQNQFNSTNTVGDAMYFGDADNVILDNDAYNYTNYLNLDGTTYQIKTNIGYVPNTLQDVIDKDNIYDKGDAYDVAFILKGAMLPYFSLLKTGLVSWHIGRNKDDDASTAFTLMFNDTNVLELRTDLNAYFGKKVMFQQTITTAGTTGNQTINKASGSVNIAAGQSAITVTNDTVSASSIVMAVVATNDTTSLLKNVVVSSGSFIVNLNATATAETKINFLVVN